MKGHRINKSGAFTGWARGFLSVFMLFSILLCACGSADSAASAATPNPQASERSTIYVDSMDTFMELSAYGSYRAAAMNNNAVSWREDGTTATQPICVPNGAETLVVSNGFSVISLGQNGDADRPTNSRNALDDPMTWQIR